MAHRQSGDRYDAMHKKQLKEERDARKAHKYLGFRFKTVYVSTRRNKIGASDLNNEELKQYLRACDGIAEKVYAALAGIINDLMSAEEALRPPASFETSTDYVAYVESSLAAVNFAGYALDSVARRLGAGVKSALPAILGDDEAASEKGETIEKLVVARVRLADAALVDFIAVVFAAIDETRAKKRPNASTPWEASTSLKCRAAHMFTYPGLASSVARWGGGKTRSSTGDPWLTDGGFTTCFNSGDWRPTHIDPTNELLKDIDVSSPPESEVNATALKAVVGKQRSKYTEAYKKFELSGEGDPDFTRFINGDATLLYWHLVLVDHPALEMVVRTLGNETGGETGDPVTGDEKRRKTTVNPKHSHSQAATVTVDCRSSNDSLQQRLAQAELNHLRAQALYHERQASCTAEQATLAKHQAVLVEHQAALAKHQATVAAQEYHDKRMDAAMSWLAASSNPRDALILEQLQEVRRNEILALIPATTAALGDVHPTLSSVRSPAPSE